MIKVEHLSKHYASVTAVDDISFEVRPQEVLGFLGPNGAGKTTTLRVLTAFQPASAGRVWVDGHDVEQRPQAVKRRIGYLPENVPLYPELRVDEYLRYRAALKRLPRAERRRAVDRAIERCGIGEVRRRIVGQLSKGFRQRVGLADALIADPKILILDEPTIGLDPNQIRQVRELIRELGRDHTVILSSHILPEVEAVCSRVLIINRGRIVGRGRPAELRAALRGDVDTIELEVRDPEQRAAAALGAVDGVRRVGDPVARDEGLTAYALEADPGVAVRERIFDTAVASGFKIVGLSSKTLSLEDIFVQITTQEEPPTPPTPPTKAAEGEGGE